MVRWTKRVALIMSLCIPLAKAECQQLTSGAAPLIVRQVGRGELVRIDPATGASASLFRTSQLISLTPQVSPDDQLVAVIVSGDAPGNRNALHVIRGNGKPLRVFDLNVRDVAWCGTSGLMAVITGSYVESSDVGFRPDSVLLVDVSSGTVRPVESVQRAWQVRWAQFDSAVYLRIAGRAAGRNVVRLDPKTGSVTPTDYLDLRFSPSGRYYLYYNMSDETSRVGWHIIERVSGREVPLPAAGLGAIQGWLFDQGDYLGLAILAPRQAPQRGMAVRPKAVLREFVVYDVQRASVVSRLSADSLVSDAITARAFPVIHGVTAGAGVRMLRAPIGAGR